MLDDTVRSNLEQTSNMISRRRFLERTLKAVFATFTALAVGQLSLQPTFASLNCCSGIECSSCPPSGWPFCTTSSGCGYCVYGNGCWSCDAGGPIYDCCDYWNGGGCSTACTCSRLVHCCAPQKG